ncbi:stimulated by retinoic acid gene 6 protein-like isoform 2-T2 [Pholidichthys leucotaenia]
MTSPTEAGISADEECDQGIPVYLLLHLSLVPAVLIVGVLSFLQKRTQRLAVDHRLPFLQGRFGVVIPLDTVGSFKNRWSYGFAFGAVSTAIVHLFFEGDRPFSVPSSVPAFVYPFVYLIAALEIGLVYFPFFACLSTPHRMAGSVMGILYSAFWITVTVWDTVTCLDNTTPFSEIYEEVITNWPQMLSLIFLAGRYLYILVKDVQMRLQKEPENPAEFIEQHHLLHVKMLLRKTSKHSKPLSWFQRRVYDWDPYFKFPCRMIGTVIISLIGLYMLTVIDFRLSHAVLYQENTTFGIPAWLDEDLDVAKKCWLVTSISASLNSVAYTFHVLVCYRLWKGQKGFLPERFHHPKSAVSVASIARYSGWQIAFTLWGYMIARLVQFILALVLAYGVILPLMHGKFLDMLNTWGTTLLTFVIAIGLRKVQEFLVLVFFLQDKMCPSDEEKPLALNNRKAFHCFNYFFFFYNVVMGFTSCIMRLLLSMAFGTWLVSRIDQTVMQRGLERIDAGYCTWIGMIFADHYHNHPVMVCFCQMLISNTQERHKSEYSTLNSPLQVFSESPVNRRARSRWTLAYTLLRNPPLILLRKHHLTSSSSSSPLQSDTMVHAFVLASQKQSCQTSKITIPAEEDC